MADNGVVHLIDDDEDVRRSLAFLLGTAGQAVLVYESAEAFLDQYRPGGRACVVSDVRMPGMDGIELLKRLRTRDAALAVIVMTGHADVPLAVEAMKAGAADFIEKPFSDDVLLAAIGAAFARQSGLRNADWVIARTDIASTLRRLGARHDLAVIERDMVHASGLLDILGEAILSCGVPCLVLPPQWQREVRFERIVIGCNGSVEAIRAIHAALPFLKAAKQVTLVDGDLGDSSDEYPRFDPFVYLLRHGITPRPSYVRASSAMAGEILLQEVGNLDADLLVMGAYGRSRMRERVFGGATRRVLEEAVIPVLMQH